jgi:hypothetical protein
VLFSDYVPNSIHNNLLIKYNDEGKPLDSFYLDASYTHPYSQTRDREIMMSDTLTGIANIGTRIYLTNDGWETFKIIRPDSVDNSAIIAIHIKDYNNFSFYHRNRNYYYTTDAGETFERIYLGGGVPISDIYFLNDDVGYMIGHRFQTKGEPIANTVILKTIDKGKSWDIILDTVIAPDNVSGPGGNQIYMLNENDGTIVGAYGVVATTNDGWKSFERIVLPRTKTKHSPYLAVTYSGNRPIIADDGDATTHGGDIYTLIDTVYMNMGAPELISPTDSSKGLLVDITFRWTKVKDIGKYVFQLAKDDKFTQIIRDDTLEVSEMQTALRWDITGLENCTDYYWRVASVKEATIKWSPTYTFRTRLEQGEQITPEDNSIEITRDTTLKWHPLNNAERYHLQISLDNQYNNLIFSQDTLRSTEHRVEKLSDNTVIFWRVRGYCFAGFGQWSPTWQFTTMNNVSVSEHFSAKLIHPNPATEYIEIFCGSIGACSNENNIWASPNASNIKIFNMLGECVLTVRARQAVPLQRIDVSHLPRGVYYLRIGNQTQMFVKM